MTYQLPAMTNAQRSVLRSYIIKHPAWPAFAADLGINSAQLNKAETAEFCARHAVDVQAVIANGAPAPKGPSPFNRAPAPVHHDTPAPVHHDTPAPHAPAPHDAPHDAAAQIAALLAKLAGGGAVDAGQVAAIVADQIAPLAARVDAIQAPAPIVRFVDKEDRVIGELPPVRHYLAERVATLATIRDVSGARPNIWLAGPMGSGKTTLARQVAAALGLRFDFHSSAMLPHEYVGYMDAGGTYHETAFVRAYRDGGLCLLDELDGSSAQATLALNAALANGIFSAPNGDLIPRHPDFVCIGAANTWGHGASAEYVGRNRLDGAFLDRFGYKLAMGYDPALEKALAGPHGDWLDVVKSARDYAASVGLKIAISPRVTANGAALLDAGMTLAEAAELTFLAGLSDQQVKDICLAAGISAKRNKAA